MSDFITDNSFGKKGEEYFLRYAHIGVFENCAGSKDCLYIKDLRYLNKEGEFVDAEGNIYEVKSTSDVYKYGTFMLELKDEFGKPGWFTKENASRINYLVYALFNGRSAEKPTEIIVIDFPCLYAAYEEGLINGKCKTSYSHGKKWFCLSVPVQQILDVIDCYRLFVTDIADCRHMNDDKSIGLVDALRNNPDIDIAFHTIEDFLKANNLQIDWNEGIAELCVPTEEQR